MTRRSWLMVGCAALLAGAGFLLWSRGYREIVWYGLLLLCPLMHLVMHGGHAHHGHGTGHVHKAQTGTDEQPTKPSCH